MGGGGIEFNGAFRFPLCRRQNFQRVFVAVRGLLHIGIRETRVCRGVVRVEFDGALEEFRSQLEALSRAFVPLEPSFEHGLVGGGIDSTLFEYAPCVVGRYCDLDFLRDIEGDFALERQDVLQFTVVGIGPEVFARRL